MENILAELQKVVESRKNSNEEGSYTCYLFNAGLDKILKKVGEECSETIIAAKNVQNASTAENKSDLNGEVADLLYHLAVMLSSLDMDFDGVLEVLAERSLKTGNKKQFKTVDKNS